MSPDEIRFKLAQAVTTYDRKQATRKHYNRYALGQYLTRVAEVREDIERGATPRAAVLAGFTGPLLTACLRAIGEPKATREDELCKGYFYKPAK